MGLGIKDRVGLSASDLGFADTASQDYWLDEVGSEFYILIADFARQAEIPYNLALEYYNDGFEAVGDVAAMEKRLEEMKRMLVRTEFGKVHGWIKKMWDEAG